MVVGYRDQSHRWHAPFGTVKCMCQALSGHTQKRCVSGCEDKADKNGVDQHAADSTGAQIPRQIGLDMNELPYLVPSDAALDNNSDTVH